MNTRDRIREFFSETTPRRALALASFLMLLVLFRKLLVTLVFFVVFSQLIEVSVGLIERTFKWPRLRAFAAALTVVLGVLIGGTWLSAGRLAKLVIETRATLPERMAALRENELFLSVKEHLPDSEQLVEKASHYGGEMAHSAAELGHVIIAIIIGLVLAIVYFFDQTKVREFKASLAPSSFTGTLLRWFDYVAEAVSITVQLQLIVAILNAVLTLPVLLIIGVPHVGGLMLLIFLSGLIPVVGNLISGAVLCVLAFQAKGWVGVGLFVGLTFALHKIESYYLNPRLTARHVKLPGFVLILSLIAWEHLLGIPGLFLSFPILFVAGKIRSEFRDEEAHSVAAAT